jgi:hypothetical protein
MIRQLDDAVTAYRNGLILAQNGHDELFVQCYRAAYILGMSHSLTPYGVNFPPHRMGLEDAEVDRETLAA